MSFIKKLKIKKIGKNLKHNLLEYKRVIKISKKPSKKEFEEVLKITGVGMILIGFIGFIIQLFVQLIEGVFG